MKNIAENILEITGNTPMIKIGRIYVKLETTNPSGSIKDRMALYMVRKAEERGELRKGMRIIEVTSGNTGIAFAMIAAARGYKFTAIMPESMSIARRKMITAFGGKIILTKAQDDMAGAIKKYKEIVSEHKNAWLPRQFENLDNIHAHREGTGQEILKQIDGRIDAFVAGIGTGGTLIGIAQALKKTNSKIIGVEPAESAVLSNKKPGQHKIQGIGEGFIPKIVQENLHLIDEIIQIKSADAISMMKKLAQKHGILVGISSGANMLAAMRVSRKYERVVTIFADRGERYI